MSDAGPEIWGPVLMTVGAYLCLTWLSPKDQTRIAAQVARAAAALIAGALAIRYAVSRVHALPGPQSPLQDAWAKVFLAFEMFSGLSGLLTLFFMSRTRDRSAEADAAQDSPLLSAPTDVFIPTYNEPRAVLERTIVGALDIDHSDLRVWVLDDGARPWVRDLAEELGALYLFRVNGEHAKAGNINAGLVHALKTGRRPEFLMILDADFVANRQFLRRTLGLFEAKDVGIVQTPHHFFNSDPVQVNLACNHVWPDEQRFFFNILLPCKDAWGASFCCGSSAVARVAALEAVGGFATETVTEDTLTSFKIQQFGWRTVLLNERLSLGLAPEGLAEYVIQRGRWCLGGIQQLRSRWSFFGRAKVDFINRLSNFDITLYWLISFPFKLIMLSNPALFWWTGTTVISASNADLVYWLLPAFVSSTMFMSIYSRNLIIPVLTDVTQLLSAVVVIGNAVVGLIRPHGRKFKVTPKGISSERITVQWSLMWPYLLIGAATVAGITRNCLPGSQLAGGIGFDIYVLWSLVNVAIISLVCLACIERPRRRLDERFNADERAVVLWPGRAGTVCRLRDISLGGARLGHENWQGLAERGILILDNGRLRLPFHTLRLQNDDLTIQFEPTRETRRALIGRLFGGEYAEEIQGVSIRHVIGTLFSRLVA